MNRLNQSKPIENYKRSYSRSNTKSSSYVESDPTINIFETNSNTHIVRIRLIFIRIGEIDTLNEKYSAEIYYEAKWKEKLNSNSLNEKLTCKQLQLINDNLSVRIDKLEEFLTWSPELLIENAIGRVEELDKWFTIKKNLDESLSSQFTNLFICEHRRVKGIFWEKLELNHFPADVQDLTISITTYHGIETCYLIPDEYLRSSINREAFFDQQEWSLYEHVATEIRQTREEYSFQDENIETHDKKHPVLSVTCRAARQPGYYYWNGFCMIFLITVCSFCIFSITPDLPQSRLQITCTLLLTSVTFRWVVNRSLPTISYLTTLDIYAIISIIILVVLCIWHSVIATIIFLNPERALSKAIEPTNHYVNVDRYIFICMFTIYICIHISLIIWLIFVPYKRRREMSYLDREYREKKHIRLETIRPRFNSIQIQSEDLGFHRGSVNPGNLSPLKSSIRTKKNQSDNLTIIPNATTFITIKEESNSNSEFHEQDDVFYDNTNDINNELKIT